MKQILKKVLTTGVTTLLGDEENWIVLPVMSGVGKGLKMRVDVKDRQDIAYITGTYDNEILKFIAPYIKKGDTVWDCGVYIGFYSVVFAKLVGHTGKVVAFEPDKYNLLQAARNAAINNFQQIEFIQAAIGGENTQLDFIVSGNTNSHLSNGWLGATKDEYKKNVEVLQKVEKVNCFTFDFLSTILPPPNFIKIDIEGIEEYALPQALKIAEKYKPLFLIESHNPDTDSAIWSFAKKANYKLIHANTYPSAYSTSAHAEVNRRELCHGTMLAIPN